MIELGVNPLTCPEPSLTPPRDYLCESREDERKREEWETTAKAFAGHLETAAAAMYAAAKFGNLAVFRQMYDVANDMMCELEKLEASGWLESHQRAKR